MNYDSKLPQQHPQWRHHQVVLSRQSFVSVIHVSCFILGHYKNTISVRFMHKTWKKKEKRFCFLSCFFMLTYHRTKKQTKKNNGVHILWLFPPIFGRVGIFLHHHPVWSSKKRSYRNLIMHNQVAYWLDKNRRCVRRCCLKTVIV